MSFLRWAVKGLGAAAVLTEAATGVSGPATPATSAPLTMEFAAPEQANAVPGSSRATAARALAADAAARPIAGDSSTTAASSAPAGPAVEFPAAIAADPATSADLSAARAEGTIALALPDMATTTPPESAPSGNGPPPRRIALPDLAQFEQYLARKIVRRDKIDLNAVVVRSVCRNLDIKLRDVDKKIAEDEFVARQGIFDVKISGISNLSRAQPANGTDQLTREAQTLGNNGFGGFILQGVTGQERKVQQNQLAVSQLLPTGAVAELLFDVSQTENPQLGSASPLSRGDAGLALTQPLLKNGGPLVTQSRIVLAGFDNRTAASTMRQQVLAAVSTSLQQYYELVFAVANVDVLRVSLAQAEELLRVNGAKFDAGVLPELDVLQAQSDVASRQQDLVSALQEVENASDLLKTQLADIEDSRQASLRPADPPRVPEYALRERVFLDEAFSYRPEMEQALIEIERQGINTKVAWNQTLPQLDVNARYTATGAGANRRQAVQQTGDLDTADWTVGLQFNYALQNREARYRFHQSEKRVDQAFLGLQKVRNDIIFDVRKSIRSVETTKQRILVGKATVEYNRAKVDSARQRQDVGLATSFDVLAFQRDLANARSTLLRSIVDYDKSLIVLEQSKGTLLESLGVQVVDGQVLKTGTKPKKALMNAR